MITDIEDYFTKGCGRCARFETPDCSARVWADGLNLLRRMCRDAGLEETVKWGHPCYMHAGRNICILGAFRGDFRLSFFNAALMTDPDGILERQGAHTRHADMLRFVHRDDVRLKARVIADYLAEAMRYAGEGILPEKTDVALDLPPELIDALDADPAYAEAFHALTPGRQRSYVINLETAKKPATRLARIAKFRDKVLAGKGALER